MRIGKIEFTIWHVVAIIMLNVAAGIGGFLFYMDSVVGSLPRDPYLKLACAGIFTSVFVAGACGVISGELRVKDLLPW